jgi:protein-S-isoprenylcysteine O-methyltransferase Ste14
VTLLRHLLAVLMLPFVVVVLVPRGLLTGWAAGDTRWPDTPLAGLPRSAGVLVFAAGFSLFAWCLWLFVRVGKGTLAPWDPTQRLVAVGPYRHTRNPMILGVVAMLAGEALGTGSWRVGAWAALVVAVNHVYFLASEEPGLEERFGEAYRAYRAAVPRWLPRIRVRG